MKPEKLQELEEKAKFLVSLHKGQDEDSIPEAVVFARSFLYMLRENRILNESFNILSFGYSHDKDCEYKTDPEKGICSCEERHKEKENANLMFKPGK